MEELLINAIKVANQVGINKYTEILLIEKRVIMRKNHHSINKIYVSHSKEIPYKEELYKPIRQDFELKKYDIILPHENDTYEKYTRDFYRDIDLMIAEVSDKATGLGIELGFAYDDNTPIYCIYMKGTKPNNSLESVTDNFCEYDTTDDMIYKIKKIINTEEHKVYKKN